MEVPDTSQATGEPYDAEGPMVQSLSQERSHVSLLWKSRVTRTCSTAMKEDIRSTHDETSGVPSLDADRWPADYLLNLHHSLKPYGGRAHALKV
ncbi:hypothetical protein H0H92_015393 [Tricholoma furcatifolium]|nr:hypothetical protein H0H92_015393 [Tricholoma furcatifolium]